MAERALRKRCGHCNQNVVIPVYKRHKNLYYDAKLNQWSTIGSDILSSDEEFGGNSSDDEFCNPNDDSFMWQDTDEDVQGSVVNGTCIRIIFLVVNYNLQLHVL